MSSHSRTEANKTVINTSTAHGIAYTGTTPDEPTVIKITLASNKDSFKSIYYLTPSLIRPFILFVYKYFILLGFLDGKIGFYYCFFNSLWFRTLIDAKKYEKNIISKNFTLK